MQTTTNQSFMKCVGHWQYSYKRELISLELNLSNNTYAYWLHGKKVKGIGYSSEMAAKDAARQLIDG